MNPASLLIQIQPGDSDGKPIILLMLSPDAITIDINGNPAPGLALTAAQAREAGNLLLHYAQQIEPL